MTFFFYFRPFLLIFISFLSLFHPISVPFPSRFRPVSVPFPSRFRPVSVPFPSRFRPVSVLILSIPSRSITFRPFLIPFLSRLVAFRSRPSNGDPSVDPDTKRRLCPTGHSSFFLRAEPGANNSRRVRDRSRLNRTSRSRIEFRKERNACRLMRLYRRPVGVAAGWTGGGSRSGRVKLVRPPAGAVCFWMTSKLQLFAGCGNDNVSDAIRSLFVKYIIHGLLVLWHVTL